MDDVGSVVIASVSSDLCRSLSSTGLVGPGSCRLPLSVPGAVEDRTGGRATRTSPATPGRPWYLSSGIWAAAPSRASPSDPIRGRRCRLRPPAGPVALLQLLMANLGPGGNPGGRVILSRVKALLPPEAFPGRHARQRVRIAMLLPRTVFDRVLEIGQPLHPAGLLVPGVLPPQQPP